MVISIDAEKSFDKIQQPYDKNSPESGHRGNLPQHNKGHVQQTHSKHHSQWWKTESISSKIRNKTRIATLATFIQHSFGSTSHRFQRRKKVKGIQIGKKEVKLSLFADDMILHIKNPKDATRKLLELINEFGKVEGYKINAQISLAFLYTNGEKSECEIKKTLPFTTADRKSVV